jgi:hypothetical protein
MSDVPVGLREFLIQSGRNLHPHACRDKCPKTAICAPYCHFNWLRDFQSEVNRATKYEGLKFTVGIWGPEKEDNTPHPKVMVEKTDYLPFLHMKLYWDEWGNLAFTVYRKDGQLLKYLNADSTHPPHVFRAAPHSVLARLANLTTLTEENGNKTMKETHPDHINAIEAANLDINALQK